MVYNPETPERHQLIWSRNNGKAASMQMRKDYFLAIGKSVTEYKKGKWITTNPDGTIEESVVKGEPDAVEESDL